MVLCILAKWIVIFSYVTYRVVVWGAKRDKAGARFRHARVKGIRGEMGTNMDKLDTTRLGRNRWYTRNHPD